MKLTVYTGSIVDPAIGADAVVNASNPDVILGSGVSGALREACGGAAFQRELRERLAQQFGSELGPNDCLVTSAGSCKAFRWVLHVPAVDYRTRDPETGGPSGPGRIRSCMRAALDAAEALGKRYDLGGRFVLATPLLGAGAGGLGPMASLDAMLKAVSEYRAASSSENETGLAKLVFVVLKAEDAQIVEREAQRHGLTVEKH